MIRADSINITSRRRAPARGNDAVLLELHDRIFRYYAEAKSYDEEISRLSEIWHAEHDRLCNDQNCTMSPDQIWKKIRAMPEGNEQSRLLDLQNIPYAEMDKLIRQMWPLSARTDEGRRAKVAVLLECILGEEWQGADEELDHGIREARQLLIEFVGGDGAMDLSFQFCTGIAGEA